MVPIFQLPVWEEVNVGHVVLIVHALLPESEELYAVFELPIQETVKSLKIKDPAPVQVLWTEPEDVSVISFVPPHPEPLPSRVMVPPFETFPERVISPAPVFVQTPLPPTVMAPLVSFVSVP